MVARKNGSHYDISEFIKSCGAKNLVLITTAARKDAKFHFNLYPDSRILGFIANDELLDLQFDNFNLLEKGSPQDIGKPVDAYTFCMGPKYVYIAFYKNFKDEWVIKSFHPPKFGENVPTLTHNPFGLLRS